MVSVLTPPNRREKLKLPLLTSLALVWMLTVDFTTQIPAGPLSLSGVITFGGAVLYLALIPVVYLSRQNTTRSRTERGLPVFLALFASYVLMRLLITPTAEGLQNVAVYISFVVAIRLTMVQITTESARLIMKRMRVIAVLVSAIFLLTFVAGIEVYGERAYALAALVFLAVLVPHRPTGGLARLAPFFVAGVIAISLSRTATAIALLLLIFLSVRNKRGSRFVGALFFASAAAAAAYWLVTQYAPLRDRFLGGDAGASIGNIQLNTSGRTTLWDITARSAEASPAFGNGPGSATTLISSMFRNIAHPHNEYLRVQHDFGYIGLVLFIGGFLALLTRTLSRAIRSDDPIHWSAFLGMLAVSAAAATDNVIIYPFVMIPLGLLVGASLGLPVVPSGAARRVGRPKTSSRRSRPGTSG